MIAWPPEQLFAIFLLVVALAIAEKVGLHLRDKGEMKQ